MDEQDIPAKQESIEDISYSLHISSLISDHPVLMLLSYDVEQVPQNDVGEGESHEFNCDVEFWLSMMSHQWCIKGQPSPGNSKSTTHKLRSKCPPK